MELLIMWLITILISYGMEMSFVFNILKDITNSGYKFNFIRLAEVAKDIDLESIKINKIMLFIPFLNMLKELQRAYQYQEQRPYILDAFRVIDALEEMTEEEIKKYNENPTVSTAIKIIIDNAPIYTVELNDNSVIYYYINDEDPANKNNIVITKVKGPAKQLSEEEQKSEIIKELNKQVNEIINLYNKFENEIEETTDNPNKADNNLFTYNQLENNQYTSENNNNIKEEEKPKTLTKKINRK